VTVATLEKNKEDHKMKIKTGEWLKLNSEEKQRLLKAKKGVK